MTPCNLIYRNPSAALDQGCWFKLICGASYQYLPAIRNLALVYTLAGADCIDVAADAAVVAAARSGIAAAQTQKRDAEDRLGVSVGQPWVMVSLNDGEDPHFRKASFAATDCLDQCWQPCVSICPAAAIGLAPTIQGKRSLALTVMADRCYGCGRCLPVCPPGIIETRSFQATVGAIATQLSPQIDAIEIHTQVGRQAEFEQCWQSLRPHLHSLQLLSVSCPDATDLISYLQTLCQIMAPFPSHLRLVWQTDGRPMSGDIGKGTTHSTIKLGQKVLNAHLPGHVQLAGGTNQHTVEKLSQLHLLQTNPSESSPSRLRISGVAYGSYARRLVQPLVEASLHLENQPDSLWQAVSLAHRLVSQLKTPPVRVVHLPPAIGST